MQRTSALFADMDMFVSYFKTNWTLAFELWDLN